MDFSHEWLYGGQVLLVELNVPPTTYADITILSRHISELMQSAEPTRVHVLVDTHEQKLQVTFGMAARANFIRHPKLGWFILVAPVDAFQRMIAGFLTRMNQINHRQFSTREQAIAFLDEQVLTATQSP